MDACGGDLTGRWFELERDVTSPPNPNVNACWNLTLSFSPEGYNASSRYPSPQGRLTLLSFQADGNYTTLISRVGPVTVKYGPECLQTEQGPPTCAQLQEGLRISGIGEGSYQGAVCTEQAGGGCSCTVQVWETGGMQGIWSVNPSQKSVTLTKPMGYPAPLEASVGYCVKNGSLRFDGPIDGGSFPSNAYTASATFTVPDCARTPEQLSADFGVVCSTLCGAEACGQMP